MAHRARISVFRCVVQYPIHQSFIIKCEQRSYEKKLTGAPREHGALAQYAKQQESIHAIRNALALAKILGSLDPAILESVARAMASASEEHRNEEKPPSLWKLIRRVNSEESRRGLSFVTLMLAGLGRSMGG